MLFEFLSQFANAQNGSIELSRYIGGSLNENAIESKTVGAFTYVFLTSTSANLPVVNGRPKLNPAGQYNFYIAKYNSTGTLVFSSYFGGTSTGANFNNYPAFEIVGDDIYFGGQTQCATFPITTGPAHSNPTGSSYDLFVAKMNTVTGNIGFCRYIGAAAADETFVGLKVADGNIYLMGRSDASYPVTNSRPYGGGVSDIVISKFDGANGNLLMSTFWGCNQSGIDENPVNLFIEGNTIHIAGDITSDTPPTSTNGTLFGFGRNFFYAKLDAGTGMQTFLTYLAGNNDDWAKAFKLVNGEAYLYGRSASSDFPTTDGSVKIGGYDIAIAKYNSSGVLVYAKLIGGNLNEEMGIYKRGIDVKDGCVYVSGITTSSNFPTTDGTAVNAPGATDIFVVKLSPTGSVVFSTVIGALSGENQTSDIKVDCNNDIYMFTSSIGSITDYPTTNGTVPGGTTYNAVISKWDGVTGKLVYSSYIPSSAADPVVPVQLEILSPGVVQFVANLASAAGTHNYPVTIAGNSWGGGSESVLTRINTCPSGHTGSPTVSPATQNICANGLTSQISMAEYSILGSSLPIIYKAGVPNLQSDMPADYQWQVAYSPTGPWTDIGGAISKNYSPPTSAVSKYYRRLATTTCCGVTTVIQTGDVAAVVIEPKAAPTVNAGSAFITCPGTAVTIGGSPTATPAPGATITSYLWTPTGAYSPTNTTANPSVSPAVSTIYTVMVTDDKGCQQMGQTNVTVYAANAGPDVSNCAGSGVRIGAQQIPVPGATYSWVSSPAGFTSTEAQPLVSPSATTTYTLTLTIPVTGGGTCNTTDAVVVTPILAPTNNGGAFGGSDVTICSGSTTTLGTTAESGFTYTWAPGNYLTSNTIATPTFQPGSFGLPSPNPFTYYVTASKGGCPFVDEVKASVIVANAGLDGCAPRIIGTPDQTSGINETYSWSVVSGTANFIGDTNQPVVHVGASQDLTIYRLEVTNNGITCTDEVEVPVCGCPLPMIKTTALFSCPSFALNNGNVTLSATCEVPANFTWTTTGGVTLSSYTGSTVSLTNANNGTVICTATNIIDPTVFCSSTIEVNNPAWTLPVFTAQDVTTCPGTTVCIGQVPVAGYSYVWNHIPGLDNYYISNPFTTVNSSTYFPVLVTDVGSGCAIRDTATVTIASLPSNVAGTNISVCSSTTGIQLGTPEISGVTYEWTSTPAGAVFSPTSTVAQPTVDVVNTTTFNVTATNTATGCSITKTMTVTVNSPVTPFSFTNSTFCPSTAGAIPLPVGPSGMSSYLWTSSGSPVINSTSNGPTATTSNPRPQVATTYTLLVTNSSGCTQAASVTLSPTITPPDAGSDKIICLNSGSVSIGSASNPTGGGETYSWSPTTGLSSSTSPNPTFTPTAAGTTIFTLTKTVSGCSITDQVSVRVNDFFLPVPTSPSICQGTSVQIGATPTTGASYFWSPATGLSNPNIANPMATPTATTNYTLVAVGANGCSATQNVIVNVTATPAPSIQLNNVTVCYGTSPTLNPVVTPVATYSYVWTPNNGTLSNVNIANPTVLLTSFSPQTYNLTVTNNSTGCSNSTNVAVTQNLPLVASISGSTTVCFGQSATVTVTLSGGTLPWNISWPTGSASNITSSSPYTFTFNTGALFNSTTYNSGNIIITDANGCTASITGSAIITVNTIANAGTSVTTPTVCNNSSVTIDLLSLIDGEDAGGIWTRTTGTGGTFNADTGTFIPIEATNSTFTYTVIGADPCPNVTTVVAVNVINCPTPACYTAIDDFSADQYYRYQSVTPPTDLFGTMITSSVLGGERDIAVTNRVGIIPYFYYIGVIYNVLDINHGVGEKSIITVIYDGIDGNAATLNPTGLGGLNFSSFTNINFKYYVSDDSIPVTVELWSNSGAASALTHNMYFSNDLYQQIKFDFLEFQPIVGAGVDLTNIGAIVFKFKPSTGGSDFIITNFMFGCDKDYGDAPDSYGTTKVNNGASSDLSSDLKIGVLIDIEEDGQPIAAANGDGTDEDGVATIPNIQSIATTYSLSVSVLNNTDANKTLQGWIDFNSNGTFEDNEYAIVTVPTNMNHQMVILNWSGLTGGVSGTSYIRLRLNDDTTKLNTDDIGYKGSGEVEDYQLCIMPNAGTAGIAATVCSYSTIAIDLFSLIDGEDAGGTWTRTTGTGGTFNAGAGTFIPTGATTSVFTYTFTGTVLCPDVTAVGTINVTLAPNAGTAVTPDTVCSSSTTAIDLFSLIDGEASGGTWTRTTGTGGTFNAGAGTFIPTGATTSSFTYTVTGTVPCLDATALGTINVIPVPVLTSITTPQTIYSGGTVTFSVTDNIGASVSWFSNVFGITGTGNPFTTSILTNSGTTPLSILFTAIATSGICSDNETTTVTVLPEPRVIIIPINSEVCYYEKLSCTITSVLPGTTINWELINDATDAIVATGTGLDNITLFNTTFPASSYTLRATGTKDGYTSGVISLPLTVN